MKGFVLFVSHRLRTSSAASLAAIGIAAGVATLMVVMAVMNGFQMSFKEAIIELTSSHVRVTGADEDVLLKWCAEQKDIRAAYPFREEKAFIIGANGRESAAIIRAVPTDLMTTDEGFAREIGMVSGTFFGADAASVVGEADDVGDEGEAETGTAVPTETIVLGSALARTLGVRVGGTVSLLALSGGSDTALLSRERIFIVAGTFHSGYSTINETCAFVPLSAGEKYFGQGENMVAVKLVHPMRDEQMMERIKSAMANDALVTADGNSVAARAAGANGAAGVQCQSWREYNSAFFGVLRVEKNMMKAIVAFIFVAVSVNIYNAMRREVYTRRGMIAVLSALGGGINDIRMIFVMRGFVLGLTGAVLGAAAGLCIAVNMRTLFMLPGIITQNPMYMLYAAIPARVQLGETIFIASFALAAPLAASWAASSAVLRLPPQETLRYE